MNGKPINSVSILPPKVFAVYNDFDEWVIKPGKIHLSVGGG